MYAFNKMLCSVEKTQNPVLLQIYSYKAGVTLLTKTEPLAKKEMGRSNLSTSMILHLTL